MAGHHRRAFQVIAVSLALVLIVGGVFAAAEHIPYWHGLYVILANAETFGGDVGPSDTLGYVCNVIVCLALIPLAGATISLVTSGWTEKHVKAAEARQNQHIEAKLAEHHDDLKAHITATLTGNGGDAP
jgi:hypothetical protein